MFRPVQLLLVLLIGLAGLASLVATSPPPGPLFYLVSENNFEDSYDGYYSSTPASAFACEDETTTLKWGLREGTNARVSAEPVSNILPELVRKSVTREGSLEILVLGNAELTLEVGRDLPDGFLRVGLVPNELCTGFAFPIIGWYEGTFEQVTPVAVSLERQLRLVWTDEGAEPFLRAELADKLLAPSFMDRLRCDYKLASSGLACIGGEGEKRLSLAFDITEDGLAGSYSGVAPSGTAVTGTFAVTKQTGAPPREPPQETP